MVRFISEKMEGKVTGIIDQQTVNVYCEDYGFEIPASVNDLVAIHSERPVSSVQTSCSKVSEQQIATVSANTLYLAIVPENFQNLSESRYELYLINDTAETCLYTAGYSDGTKHLSISAGNCDPNQTVLLGSYNIKELDRMKEICIQSIFYRKGTYEPRKPVDSQIRISMSSLYKAGAYKHVRWFANMAFIRSLEPTSVLPEEKSADVLPEVPKHVIKEKSEFSPAPASSKPGISNVVEIDLHIGQLLDTTTGMANKDILEYQLDVFRQTLEKYKLRKGQKIVFIHGKGDGVLRQRLLWELQTRYKRFHHQDASFKQYGYGATLVTIK